jgi:hypothetical protein
VRVQRLGLAEQRQDLGLVVGDGEVLLGKVGLPGGQVVEGVVGGGDVATELIVRGSTAPARPA